MKTLILMAALSTAAILPAQAQQVIAKGSWEAVAADGTALGSFKTSDECVTSIRSNLHAAVTEAKALQVKVTSAPVDNVTDAQVADSRRLVYLDNVVEAYANANCVQQ
ncbi:MAG: hypothetical protein P4L87_00250 [Formivibrio sp.]|nr:hypothetical protein [Formivibrio sp.]